MTKILPPRKKDWKLGTTQLGLFIRFADGRVFEITQNDAPPETAGSAVKLMTVMVQGLTPKEKL